MRDDRDLGNDLRDTADEAKHRAAAVGERAKRAVEPMNVAEKAASHIKEAGHNMAADVDRAKRDTREDARRDVDDERSI